MLASMDEGVSDRFDLPLRLVDRICHKPVIMRVDRCDDRRGLHEIGTRANNSKNLHCLNLRPSHGSTSYAVTLWSRQSVPRSSLKQQRACFLVLPDALSARARF